MNRIKEIRLQKELMQKDVARRACISSPYLHDIENGNRKAGRQTSAIAGNLSSLLGIAKDSKNNVTIRTMAICSPHGVGT